jgi:hypothetical protein
VSRTNDWSAETPQESQGRLSSGVNLPTDTPSNEERTCRENSMSSLDVVAGACYVAMHNALPAFLVRRLPLPRRGRRAGGRA